MKIFIPLILITLYSCGNSDQKTLSNKKISELKIYIEETIKGIDSTVVLDSFRFISLDTLTQQHYYYGIISDIYNEIDKNNRLSDLSMPIIKSNAQLASLWRGLDNTLYNNYKREYEDEKEKFEELQKKSTFLLHKADSFNVLRENADTIQPIAYETINLIQVRAKDQSVRKDTAYIFLNLDKNIIKREDLFKYE